MSKTGCQLVFVVEDIVLPLQQQPDTGHRYDSPYEDHWTLNKDEILEPKQCRFLRATLHNVAYPYRGIKSELWLL